MTRRVKEPVAEVERTRNPESVVERSRSPLDLSSPQTPARQDSGPQRSGPQPVLRDPLDLSPRPAPAPSAPRGLARTVESRLYPAPAFGGLHQLTASHAVVRLNPRQAAIGSLFVTGTRGTAWEGEDRTTGAQSVHREQIGTAIPTPGNRPLVSFVNRDAVVVLRHVRSLRRALFIGAGGTMTVQTFDGSAIAVQGALGPGQRTVLTATRIGALLELRAESVPEQWDDGEIWREFAFTMTVGLGTLRR
ncbi:hypothetical protein [Sinomonas sp. P10A9]|uniref:Uncharacterized protein n=1 Tax=Sinomonas puerhi TaxID=3238584 RepID=A0AB39L2B9_9MICC